MPLPQSTTLPSSGFGGYGTFNPLLDVTQKRSASAQTKSTTVLILKWSIIWDGLISYLEGKRRRGGEDEEEEEDAFCVATCGLLQNNLGARTSSPGVMPWIGFICATRIL